MRVARHCFASLLNQGVLANPVIRNAWEVPAATGPPKHTNSNSFSLNVHSCRLVAPNLSQGSASTCSCWSQPRRVRAGPAARRLGMRRPRRSGSRSSRLTGQHAAGRGAAVATGLTAATAPARERALLIVELGEVRHPALRVFEHDSVVVLHRAMGVGGPVTVDAVVAGRTAGLASSGRHRVVLIFMHRGGHVILSIAIRLAVRPHYHTVHFYNACRWTINVTSSRPRKGANTYRKGMSWIEPNAEPHLWQTVAEVGLDRKCRIQ